MNLDKLLTAFKDETYISISEIQRRMGVGYLTAGKYLVELIDKSLVHKNEQGKYVFSNKTNDTGMNIIFLDVDGVLNCSTTKDKCGQYTGIEDKKVELLKEIVDKTNAKLVLVSTWRFYWYKEKHLKDKQDNIANYLDQKLAKYGLEIYDKVDDYECLERGESILEYLSVLAIKKIKVNKFVIIDDEAFDYLKTKLTKNLASTSYVNGGLQKKHIKKILEKMAD